MSWRIRSGFICSIAQIRHVSKMRWNKEPFVKSTTHHWSLRPNHWGHESKKVKRLNIFLGTSGCVHTQHNNIQRSNIRHNDNQHNKTQHNDNQQTINMTLGKNNIRQNNNQFRMCWVSLMLNVGVLLLYWVLYAECQYEYCGTFTMTSSKRWLIKNLSFRLKVVFLSLYWLSLRWVSLCWVSLCWVSLCWVLFCWELFCWVSVWVLQNLHNDFIWEMCNQSCVISVFTLMLSVILLNECIAEP